MSRWTLGSQSPPPPAPRTHPQHAALAADARCPVLVARLDGFGAVDNVRAIHEDLGGGLHRDELWVRASERGITAREPTLRPRIGSHLRAQSWIRLRQWTAWALGLRGSEEKRRCHAPTTPPDRAWLATRVLGALNPGSRKESPGRASCALPRCAPLYHQAANERWPPTGRWGISGRGAFGGVSGVLGCLSRPLPVLQLRSLACMALPRERDRMARSTRPPPGQAQ